MIVTRVVTVKAMSDQSDADGGDYFMSERLPRWVEEHIGDEGYPLWLPGFMRMSKDGFLRPHEMRYKDREEIEYFSLYVLVTLLVVRSCHLFLGLSCCI